ncbi:MAG: hypothetical protein JWQ27_581 [Ferruginibacter sp.]|nr:hypothetical protein [Ferruginibacter sp.]
MKKITQFTGIVLCLMVALHSCSMSNSSFGENRPEVDNPAETKAVCFVSYKDGTVKYFSNLKLVTGVFTTPHLLADGKIKISGDEIKAYQNKDHYAVSQEIFCCGRKSNIAKESLPGFAVRIAAGKINVYCKKYFNGSRAVDEYFVQAGTEGKIMAYSPEIMHEMIKDNPEAAEFFKSKKMKNNDAKKLFATVEIYNKNQMISKN